MALVMLGEQQLVADAAGGGELGQRLLEVRLLEQLLLEPQRHRQAEGAEAARRVGEIGLEQALELDQRLLEEDDVVDAVEVDAGGVEAIADRVRRESPDRASCG